MKYEDLRFAVDDFLRKAIMPNVPPLMRVLAAFEVPRYVADNEPTAIEFMKKNGILSEDGIIDYELIANRLNEYVFGDKDSIPIKVAGIEFVIRKEHVSEIIKKAITKSTQV